MFELVDPYADWPADIAPPPSDGDLSELAESAAEATAMADAWTSMRAAEIAAEFEQLTAVQGVADLDPATTLAEAAATVAVERQVLSRQLQLAAHWADLNGALEGQAPEVPGVEVMVSPGGDGTPQIAEFAAAELGAALGITATAAMSLIADALDLRHRFPRVWHHLVFGQVRVWTARRVADRTRRLSRAAAGRVDRRIAGLIATMPWARLSKILDAAIIAADPERAKQEAEQERARTGVWVSRQVEHGHSTLFARANAGDLAAFDEALDVVARALGALGDPGDLDQRRAAALGVLADPQAALDLVADANRAVETRAGGRALRIGTAMLFLHLTKADLDDLLRGDNVRRGSGVARVEGLGPILTDCLADWLGHREIVVRPVLDPGSIPPADCYEVPPRMREALHLTKPADCFPNSPNLSRHQDADHTVPHVPKNKGGPPGQTRLDNLGLHGRGNHRIKTHGGWRVSQPRSGTWLWRSPHGRGYLVDQYGTLDLGPL